MSDLVTACPGCDSADLQKNNPGSSWGTSESEWLCNGCLLKFDVPVMRKRRGNGSRHGLAKQLLEANPDDVAGPRPAGSQTESDDVRGGA